ncbi:MAG TPA: T9SS type A sorting domain-containing protein [Segetibacter sp.]
MKRPLPVFFVTANFIACILFSSSLSYGQVSGCKDPLANNYNAAATVNDGSCLYNSTNYAPIFKTNLSSTLAESSGLQMANNFLWSFNDGGGSAAIYRIDTITNAILQTVNLTGATNVDWEDIAFDGTNFYIGDFGNNANGARTDLKIYKFPIAAIPDYVTNPVASIPATQIQEIKFIYNDQPQPPIAGASNLTKFDCEAMIVDGGIIHLFTKNWIDTTSTHYILTNITTAVNIAVPVETLATGYLVTAADKAVGRNTVALLGYQNTGFANHFMYLLTDYSAGRYFNGNKRKINLGTALDMGQAEGITFRNSTYGYISNENFFTISQRLKSFDIANFVSNAGEVLAINFSSIKALQKTEGVQVQWVVASDKNVAEFIVEKSVNGQTFIEAAKVNGRTGSSYSADYNWLDKNVANGNNYYRIKAIEKSGREKISQIVTVKTNSNLSDIKVFPNPVVGKSLQLIMNNQEQGHYLVELFNSKGQLMNGSTISHLAGSSTEIVPLDASLPKGVYQLKVSKEKFKRILSVLIN